MYLKKLELLGFKSFADRTEFVFQPGVTAVVGPNGCGKSNVVDAFKWIFGEQSAKGLRGSEMKDVIFNGTQERKPTGFAEVTIIFENSDRFLDIDYSEVAITRRLYRSGESEYLINKQRCRLKDIRMLFMGTGIGQTSYSILEQGKIDVLLQASDVDRRFIFEEAAGISKYLVKKGESLRALARVEENLTRLNDIIGEVEKRLQRLKAQASRARRFKELSDRLKDLKVRLALEDYSESVRARADLTFRLEWVTRKIRRVEELIARVSALLETQSAERHEAAEKTKRTREQLASERLLIERTLERIDQERRRAVDLAGEKARQEEEIEAITRALGTLEERLATERRELEGAAAGIDEKRAGLERLARDVEKAESEKGRLEDEVRARKAGIVALIQKASRIGNSRIQIEAELANLVGRKARIETALSGFRAALAGAQAGAGAERERCDQVRRERERLEAARGAAEEAGAGLEASLSGAEARLAENQSHLAERCSRHDVLESLEQNLEGVGRGVADILRRRPATAAGGDPGIAEVHGMAGSLLKVESAYARAVEAALGPRAQSLVVSTQDGALALLDVARRDELGAVEVISLDRVDRAPGEHFPRQVGVLGPLRDRVESPAEFADLFDRLLADVVLVEDFATALALSRNGLRPFRLVTLEGEVVEPWGGLSIAGEKELGIISRRSEMEDLRREAATLEAKDAALRAEQAALREDLAKTRERLDCLREDCGALDRTIVQKEETIAQLGREGERLEREIAVGLSECAGIDEEAAARGVEKLTLDGEAAQVAAEERRVEEEVVSLEAQVSAAAAATAAAAASLGDARLVLAQAEERAEALQVLVAREEADLAERRAQVENLRETVLGTARRAAETAESLRACEADLVSLREKEGALARVAEEEAAAEKTIEEFEETIRKALDDLREKGAAFAKEREAAQLREQEEKHRRNGLVERLEEEYGVDLERLAAEAEAPESAAGTASGAASGSGSGSGSESGSESESESDRARERVRERERVGEREGGEEAEPPWDRERAREEIRELQEKIRRLGGVNLEALDELKDLEERYRFQEAQRADLVASEKNLRGIIGEINATSRDLFLKTFEEVQGHFSDLFRKCFEGGKAELVLQEGVDILEAGIDIVAKPPGKKITSLSLMSGGEKTMTTIALLFAIFRARPSPFCILDEVDAPLDESNVGRFVVLLKDFLAQTQFIIVTHNKVTMAEANTLYGVTMEEHGVSKRVSVELETYDPEKLAAAAHAS